MKYKGFNIKIEPALKTNPTALYEQLTRYRAAIKVLNNRKSKYKLEDGETGFAADGLGISAHSELTSAVQKIRRSFKSTSYRATVTLGRKGSEVSRSFTYTDQTLKHPLIKQAMAGLKVDIQAKRKASLPKVTKYRFNEYDLVVPKMDEVYLEKNTFVMLLQKKLLTSIYRNKKPETMDNHVGVEMEFGCKVSQEVLAQALYDAGVAKHVTVKDDSSIKVHRNFPDYAHPIEVCVIAKQELIEDVVTKVCAVMASLGTKVDKSCGLHVHIDMRSRLVIDAYSNLVTMQDYLYQMNPKSRMEGDYSKRVPNRQWDKRPNGHRARYHGVNATAFDKFQTLEIRMHAGSTDARKINYWIKLLLAIATAPVIKRVPSTLAGVQRALSIDTDLLHYMEARTLHFKSQHTDAPPSNTDEPTF